MAIPLTALSACANYEASPVDLMRIAESREDRTLNEAAIDATQQRLAPTALLNSGDDRLWLLAAMLEHDPRIDAARAAIRTAEARAKSERHVMSPVLTLTSEYANDPTTSSPWLIGGAIDLPLDVGGRRSARLRSADVAKSIARYDFAEVLWTERMAVRRALIDHFIALRRIGVAEASVALSNRQLAAIERRLHSGAASNVEVEPVRLYREAATRDLALAEAQLAQADEAIAAAIGVPATALAHKKLSWEEFDQPDDAVIAKTENVRIAAITRRADVLRALADYDRADSAYRGEIAKQFPALTLSPGYTWERGLVKIPVSLGLALPPLDLNRHAIAAAVEGRKEAGKRLEEVVASAGSAIDAALMEQKQAAAALANVRDHDLPVARAMAKRADDRLQIGDIDRVEWAEAQRSMLDARGREIDALARVQTARAALEDAMRRPLEGPETMITVPALEITR